MVGETTPTRVVSAAPRRALTVAGAAVAALAAWALAGPVAGVGLDVQVGGAVQHVEPVAVVVAALLAGLAAWALLALLERTTRRPGLVWTVIAFAVLVLSLLGPLGAVDTASVVSLAGMHLVVAAVLIPGLGGSARDR
ncbi:DUF6069 family protein [Sphaerisporangium sp. NPDC088356]|uniref:DUF6069 family protein n=1 Tax=Sphaerisporangium sp. NPDC088356 TaxID=3154871 RepID=UPI003434CBDD